MENLLSPWGQTKLGEGIYTAGMPSDRKLQQIAIKNIGDLAAVLIGRGESVFGKRYEIAGDDLSGDNLVAQLSKAAGRTIIDHGVSPEFLRGQSADMADMFEWFDKSGYTADISKLMSEFPEVNWLSFLTGLHCKT